MPDTTTIILLGLALLAMAGGLMIFERLVVDPVLGAKLVIGLVAIVSLLTGVIPNPRVGGFNIIWSDMVFSLIVGAAIARMLRLRSTTLATRVLGFVGVFVLLSALRGIPAFGPNDALRESRNFFSYFGGALYFTTFRLSPEHREELAKVWLWGAAALSAVVLFRWAALVGGLPQTGIFARAQEPGSVRVIDGRNGLILAQVFVMLVMAWSRGQLTMTEKRLAILLGVLVLGLQHRTVWLALLGAIIVVALRDPRIGRPIVAGLSVLAVSGAFVIVQISSEEVVVSDDPETAFLPRNPADSGTFEWRAEGWHYLLFANGVPPAEELLLGQPFGAGYPRELENGNVVDTVPHNFYIETYLRAGLLGLIGLLMLFWNSTGRLARRRLNDDARLLSSETLYVLVLMQMIHLMAWSPDLDQSVMLGIALSVAFTAPKARLRAPEGLTPWHRDEGASLATR